MLNDNVIDFQKIANRYKPTLELDLSTPPKSRVTWFRRLIASALLLSSIGWNIWEQFPKEHSVTTPKDGSNAKTEPINIHIKPANIHIDPANIHITMTIDSTSKSQKESYTSKKKTKKRRFVSNNIGNIELKKKNSNTIEPIEKESNHKSFEEKEIKENVLRNGENRKHEFRPKAPEQQYEGTQWESPRWKDVD